MTEAKKSGASDQPEAEKLDKATRELFQRAADTAKQWAEQQEEIIASQTRFDKRQAEMQRAADKNRGA